MTTKKFTKTYVGKGRRIDKLPNVIAVTLNFDELEDHVFEYDGKRFLKFEVAPLREADKFGRTHTAYISVMDEVEEEKPAPKAKPDKKKKEEPVAEEVEADNVPF